MENDKPSRAGPLQGVRIVDLTTVVLGPYASQMLGEYGADVIKVEAPGGDSTRRIGPSKAPGMGALFLGVNRSKRSIELDLKAPEGRDTLLALVAKADVFMHNMRPDKLEALGLGANHLRKVNERLIFTALLGFGSRGPYAGQPAYDDVIQGLSGFADMMHAQSGVARYLPTTIADKVASMFAVQAIMAALLQRERTNAGCNVEVPMFEAVVSFGLVEHMQAAHFDPAPAAIGYQRALMPHRKPFPTLDGYLCVMPYSDLHWRSLFEEVKDLAALADPRFADLASRTLHIGHLYKRLAEHVATRSTAAWLDVCRRLDIPAARMNRMSDLMTDPHLQAVEHFVKVHDAEMGDLVFPSNPVRFDDWQPPIELPPRLGEHTEMVCSLAREGWPR